LAEGGRRFPPHAVVKCWLTSTQGHREYLLSPRVTKAGVGVAKSHGKTFVAWAFSDSPPSYPDCPHYKHKIVFNPNFHKLFHTNTNRIFIRRKFWRIAWGLIALFAILIGLHGIYVYFNRIELFFTLETNYSKLFLVIPTPVFLQPIVFWATKEGLQSWFMPALILAFAVWLFIKSRLWDIIRPR